MQTLRTLRATCKDCGWEWIIKGEDIKDITHQLDESGWYDGLDVEGELEFLCPACLAKRDESGWLDEVEAEF